MWKSKEKHNGQIACVTEKMQIGNCRPHPLTWNAFVCCWSHHGVADLTTREFCKKNALSPFSNLYLRHPGSARILLSLGSHQKTYIHNLGFVCFILFDYIQRSNYQICAKQWKLPWSRDLVLLGVDLLDSSDHQNEEEEIHLRVLSYSHSIWGGYFMVIRTSRVHIVLNTTYKCQT